MGHTVPVKLEKCQIFLEKYDRKWSPLRKITAAKSHDFVAVGTPGRIWTSDPSLRRRMLYPTELRGQMAIFDYFTEYSELFTVFCFLWFRILPNFIFVKKVRIFDVFIFRTFSKGDRSNYHLGGERSILLSYGRILWNLGKLGFKGISLTFSRKGTKGYQTGCQISESVDTRSRNRRFPRVFSLSCGYHTDRARP